MTHKPGSLLSPIQRDWLTKKLAPSIWYDPMGQNNGLCWLGLDLMPGHSIDRSLSHKEIQDVKRLVDMHYLPCLMLKGDISYSFCIAICDHVREPHLAPKPVFAFSNRHLPGKDGHWPEPGYAWSTLADTFSHTHKNSRILASYGLPIPGGRKLYEV